MLRRSFAAAAVCLLSLFLTVDAGVAPPRAIITGPTGGQPGDILLLDASESEADYFVWGVEPELAEHTTIMPIEDGRKCIVATKPGSRTIFLSVSNAEGIDQIKWKVTVGDNPPPGPGPGPGPPPEPDPPGPDDVYGLQRLAHTEALKVVSPNRAAEASRLAGGFEGVAARISAGTLSKPQAILTALLRANNDALGASLPQWLNFGRTIAQRLQVLYESGEMRSLDDWAAALRAVSIGLQAVRS